MELTPRQQEADTALTKALEFWQAKGFTPSEMHDAMRRSIVDDMQKFASAHLRHNAARKWIDESFLPLYSLHPEPDSELPDQGAIKAFIRGAKAWLIS